MAYTPNLTYKLQIRLANPYDPNPFQLSFRCVEENRDTFIYAGTSVSGLKTVAAAIFAVSGLSASWVDDASTEGVFPVGSASSGVNPANGTYSGVTVATSYEPLASDLWFTLTGANGAPVAYPTETTNQGV